MTHWQVRFVVALTVIILFSLTAGIAWASDISQALYVGTVRVHNDNVTATAVSTNMTLVTQNLIDLEQLERQMEIEIADDGTVIAIRDLTVTLRKTNKPVRKVELLNL